MYMYFLSMILSYCVPEDLSCYVHKFHKQDLGLVKYCSTVLFPNLFSDLSICNNVMFVCTAPFSNTYLPTLHVGKLPDEKRIINELGPNEGSLDLAIEM